MSDYISKSDVIKIIEKAIENSSDFLQHDTQIDIMFEVQELPTLDEKEIIRNAAKRIIDRLEYQKEQYESRAEKFAEALNSWEESRNRGKAYSYSYAIEIVKEECGINE